MTSCGAAPSRRSGRSSQPKIVRMDPALPTGAPLGRPSGRPLCGVGGGTAAFASVAAKCPCPVCNAGELQVAPRLAGALGQRALALSPSLPRSTSTAGGPPQLPTPRTNGPQGVQQALYQRDPVLLRHGWNAHTGQAHELDHALHHPLREQAEAHRALVRYGAHQ